VGDDVTEVKRRGRGVAAPLIMETQRRTEEQQTAIRAMRAKIARFGTMLYDRRLTDAAGGNISALVGDVVCFSPRYAGSLRQWQLQPDDVLVVDLDGNVLEGNGALSRESKVHLRLYREFGEHGTGVIHAHARNLLVFAAMARPLPPVLEATRKFGTIPVIDFAPAHSAKLAENVAGAIRGNEARIRKQAAGAIAPWHGLFVIGKDIDAAFDAVERIDNNAYIILMAEMLKQSDLLESERQAMEAACANFTE
jgi:L-fuculose-phosphate aldolase